METGELGKTYQDGEVIYRQGEKGACMYVILDGKVEVYLEKDGQEVPLRLCREGDFLGETALFNEETRSVNARSLGHARLLTVDKKNFFRRIHEDPTIAFRLVQELTRRVRELDEDVAVLSRAMQECLNERLAD
jgi:CRP-like cAMP-binding protein